MIQYDQGREYWTLVKRFNTWRKKNPGIAAVVVSDMIELLPHVQNEAVKRRIRSFIARNQPPSPGNDGGRGGPRYA